MMKSKGFTLLEMLVSIAILGIIISLIWKAYLQTEMMRDTTEAKSDQISAVISAVDMLSAAFQALEPTTVINLDSTLAEFQSYFHGEYGSFQVESAHTDHFRTFIRFRSKENSNFERVFPIALTMKYWDGQTWLPSWQRTDIPVAVVFELKPEPINTYQANPYRICIAIPSGNFDLAMNQLEQPVAAQEDSGDV